MPTPDSEPGRSSQRQEWFAVTRWSVVLRACESLTTRRGAGLYKVPSLLGVWYRGPFEHNGSCEDRFDLRRVRDDYVSLGWERSLRHEHPRGEGARVGT